MRVAREIILAATALAAASCVGESSPSSFTARDSAGVRITESSAPSWTPEQAWTVDPTPLLDLAAAGAGPGHELYDVRNAIRLRDGRIAVANRGSNDVRVFAPDGSHILTFGREGEGPGEFQRLTGVHRYRGDSIALFDFWAKRITVLDSAWVLGRTAPLSGFDAYPGDLYPIEDGRFVVRTNSLEFMEAVTGRIRIPSPLILLDPAGAGTDTVATAAGFETHVFDMGDARPPYPIESVQDVRGDRLYVGDANTMEYRVYGLDGKLRDIVRIPAFDLTIPEHDRDTLRAAMLQREMPAFLRPTQERMANEIPTRRAAYSALKVGPDGDVWLASYLRPAGMSDQPREWLVFGAEGEWLGTVALPPNFDLYEVGADYVLGRSRDELEVETVQMLRLDRK